MSRARRSWAALFATSLLLAAAAVSCGSSTPSQPDAGDSGEPDTMQPDATCTNASDAGPTSLPVVALDGGVALHDLPLASATLQCAYYAKCWGLADYVEAQCIQSLTGQNAAWQPWACTHISAGVLCSSTNVGPLIATGVVPPLEGAVEAGAVSYDPVAAAACLRALQVEGCTGNRLELDSVACASVFSCPDAGPAADAQAPADASADANPTCPELLAKVLNGPSAAPCANDGECAGSTPYCFDGYCASRPCGEYREGPVVIGGYWVDDGGCPSPFRTSGETCDSDLQAMSTSPTTAVQRTPAMTCAPGLACVGLAADGGLGQCKPPGDVGAACVTGTTVSGCKSGLVCDGCTCQVPPAQGACFDDFCEVGVAYCGSSNVCTPVGQLGSPCGSPGAQCAPDLACDTASNTCQQPAFAGPP